jgi:hypothetical protein
MTHPLSAPALRLHPRSSLLARLASQLDRAAERLDALDPPRGATPATDDVRPVLRLVREPQRLPRADR